MLKTNRKPFYAKHVIGTQKIFLQRFYLATKGFFWAFYAPINK